MTMESATFHVRKGESKKTYFCLPEVTLEGIPKKQCDNLLRRGKVGGWGRVRSQFFTTLYHFMLF